MTTVLYFRDNFKINNKNHEQTTKIIHVRVWNGVFSASLRSYLKEKVAAPV
jgi:hypothetical protein